MQTLSAMKSATAYFAAGASRLVDKSNPDDLGKLAGPFDSPFYVVRPADAESAAAIAHPDSIVRIRAPRQVGKTSLLARGLQQARQAGSRIVITDLQRFDASHLASAETLLLALAQEFAARLELEVSPVETWESGRGASRSFCHYLRHEVLGSSLQPVVWALDEVDRLFPLDYAGEIFGLSAPGTTSAPSIRPRHGPA
jgi:hypothetical protein